MIRRVLFGTLAVLAGSAVVASAAPKEEVTDAAKKLSGQGYSWKQTSQNAGGAGGGGGGGRGGRGGFGGGAQEGKADKDGVIHVVMGAGTDFQREFVVKGEAGESRKGAIKNQDGEWQSLAEASEGDPGPATFMALAARNFRTPEAIAADLASKAKDLKEEGDAIVGELTPEGVRAYLFGGGFGFGRRGGGGGGGGGQGPEISNGKGTVKFWVKDGAVSKIEYNVKGGMAGRDGNQIDIDRTTTIEIKDVGSTKVDVPEAAKKKIG